MRVKWSNNQRRTAIIKILNTTDNKKKYPGPRGNNKIASRNKLKSQIDYIKPKHKQDVDQTKKDINKNIQLADLKTGVADTKSTKTGNIEIKCQTENEIDILKNLANIKGNYDIQRQPKIKIVQVFQEFSQSETETNLMIQNNIRGVVKS